MYPVRRFARAVLMCHKAYPQNIGITDITWRFFPQNQDTYIHQPGVSTEYKDNRYYLKVHPQNQDTNLEYVSSEEVCESSADVPQGRDDQDPYCSRILTLRGCSHITSAKNRGSYTPPPPSVSNGQHLTDPPSLWLFDMIKWGIFIC